MPVVTEILGSIDGIVETYTSTVFESFAAVLAEPIRLSAAIGVAMIGANMIFQVSQISFVTGAVFIARLMVTFLLATSWVNFSLIYDLLTDLPNSLGGQYLAAGGLGGNVGLYAALDNTLDKVNEIATDTSATSSLFGVSLLGILIGVIAWLLAAISVFVIGVSKILLAVMVALAPIAFLASFFKSTLQLFMAWTQATISVALTPVVAAGVVAVILSIGTSIIDGTATDLSTIGEAGRLMTLLIVAIIGMAVVPTIVRSLSGSILSMGSGLTEAIGTYRQGRQNTINAATSSIRTTRTTGSMGLGVAQYALGGAGRVADAAGASKVARVAQSNRDRVARLRNRVRAR